MRHPVLILGLAAPMVATQAACDEGELPTARIQLGEHRLTVEVARTEAQRARGLMYRRSLGKDRGMIFAYDHDEVMNFWMHNTFIPLSIAFLSPDGTVLHITDMRPQTTTPHSSEKPARYALEVNQGWFREHGITVGSKVDLAGIPAAP